MLTLVWAALILGETLTGAAASAAVVVLLSVVATQRTPRPSARVGFIQDAAAARP